METEDESHALGPVETGSILLEVVKYRADCDAGIEGAGDAQLFNPHRFDVVQDEVAHPHLDGADAALFRRPCRPAVLEAAHH